LTLTRLALIQISQNQAVACWARSAFCRCFAGSIGKSTPEDWVFFGYPFLDGRPAVAFGLVCIN
jgi:hypothetical protein